jgi:predicted phosphodiesterase
MQRASAPRAEIRYLEGNHDRRLSTSIIANAKAAFGLKKSGSEPTDWPVLSVPNLLRLDELKVEYIGGYPASITWINDRLACIHGHRVKSNGSTAASVIEDERMSVIFGHTHRIDWQYKTRRVRDGGRTNLAVSPGCLCLRDGSVPSTKGGMDPMGRPVPAVENWQSGFASVIYRDGDERFHVDVHPIFDGETLFYGQMLAA